MEENQAAEFLSRAGYAIDTLSHIPEGNSHEIFSFVTVEGEELIARFEKAARVAGDGKRRDFHYNGEISLEREAALCRYINKTVLPAPRIRQLHTVGETRFLVVEKLPGVHWKTFLEKNSYATDKYLQSLTFLGKDIACFQRLIFESYGDVMAEGKIEPPGITNFAQRLEQILELKLGRAQERKIFNKNQNEEVHNYFQKNLGKISFELAEKREKPVFVVTDLHPMNFFVDQEGKPSGYFDLEFCQAGHPALEFYNLKLQLFNYFDEKTFSLAQDSFFRGFREAGGVYEPANLLNQNLETTLGAGHILSAVTAYHNARDGLRDKWGAEFKDILFNVMATGTMDYVAFADVIRQKTKQPKEPTLP